MRPAYRRHPRADCEALRRQNLDLQERLLAAIWDLTACRAALKQIAARGCRLRTGSPCGRCDPCLAAAALASAGDGSPSPLPEEQILEPGEHFEGTYVSHRDVRIFGRLTGRVEAEGRVYVERDADVSAVLRAESATVEGRFEGIAQCSGRFEVLSTGVVRGDVTAGSLVVEEGAWMSGRVRTCRCPEPGQRDDLPEDARPSAIPATEELQPAWQMDPALVGEVH